MLGSSLYQVRFAPWFEFSCMAASQMKKQQQDEEDEHPIPRELFQRVNAARQPCAQFKVGRCRKYKKRPRSHDIDGCSHTNFTLPYTSRYITDDGRDVITLRPPLTLAALLGCSSVVSFIPGVFYSQVAQARTH